MSVASIFRPQECTQYPVVDWTVLDQIREVLAPAPIELYLQTLYERGDALLQHIGVIDIVRAGEDVADAIHAFSGTADMFGFKQVASLGRRLEYALREGAASKALAGDFASATIAALDVMRQSSAIRSGRS